MRGLRYGLLVGLAVIWTVSLAATALPDKPQGQGAAHGKKHAKAKAAASNVATIFSEHDQQLIRGYYGGSGGLPPGLAKRGGDLPPGLEKHLQRNGTLPPGLQKRVEPFPPELNRQLPPLPSGCSRAILAGRALILDRKHRVLDLMMLGQ